MSYEGLLSATYGQTPDLVQLCNTTPPRCPLDDMQQLSHSNSYNFEALIASPWVKQYRSMCAEFGRNLFPSDRDATMCTFPLSGDVGPASHKSVNDDAHPNSVGQRVFSFLRGAFRRTSDDVAQELAAPQSDKHRTNGKQNKKLECLVSHKSWRTSTPWIGRRKENQTNNQISKTVITNKQLFAIRHSGSRSAEHFKKRTHSPSSHVRDTSSAPLDQSNSQNSTPTSRPSALVTTRSSSDKSRGTAKRTRFSLHPSTCNAPPELIRRRRDGDESATPLSATAESFTKSNRGTIKLVETSECIPKRFDSESSLVPKHVGDVGSCASEAEYNPTDGKPQTALRRSAVSNVKEHGKSAVELNHQKFPVSTYTNSQERVNSVNPRNVVNEKTEPSAPQTQLTKVTSSPKRSNISSQPVSTPVVTVAPVIKVVPRRMNSSSATSERKRVTFETPAYHSVPSTPVSSLDLDSPPVQRKNSFDSTIRRFCGENSEQFQEHTFSENSIRRNVQENGQNTDNLPQHYLDGCSETAVVTKALDVKSDVKKRRVCRFRRYRRMIADFNQIYRNYAAPCDLTRELVDEICQIEITHIVRSLLTEELKHGPTPDLDNKMSATNKNLGTPVEQAIEKVSEDPGKQEFSLRKCDMAVGMVENRKFMDLDEWFGLKPISNTEKETHLGRILSSTCSVPQDRRGTLETMDAFPTKDLNDPKPQDFHSKQSHTSAPREMDSMQASVNTYVKKFLNIPNSDASQRLQGGLEKRTKLYSVHQIAFEPEEAPKLELRSQQLTETMEDHFSSEMEFSDEYNIACSSLSSKEVRLNHLVHSPAGDLRNRSAKAEQPVTLTCHCAQTCRPTGLTVTEPQLQCGKPKCTVPELVYNKASSSNTKTSITDQNAKKCSDSVERNFTITPIHAEDSSEQKRTTESDELSTTHLWNQIHQSLVELTSLSDEGLRTTPERATATVRLERASSSVARSDTVDSLSPCLSRMGPSFNPDVTGFSEPSVSTISIPDDNSSIPWSRARIVVLRDSVNQCSNTTPTTIIVRRQVSHVSCQTESSFIQNESELRNKYSSTRSNDSVYSCPCHHTEHCNACGTMNVEGNGHPTDVTSRGEMRPESSQNTCPLCSAHNNGISLGSPVISNHAEVAVQTETSQSMTALKVGSNSKVATSGPLADKLWSLNVERCSRTRIPGTKEVAKSILSDSMPQVRDVGDCVRKRSSLWDPTLVLKPKSKSSAASNGSLGLISRSHLDIHSKSGKYRESAFSPIPRKTTTSDQHSRVGRSQKTGSKTIAPMWVRRTQPDTDASSGDSQLGNSTILYRKSHSNYLGRHGRVDQKIPHPKRLSRDPESELSDGEASSSVSSTRQGYPCRRRAERRTKPLKSLSQPPAFEMVRLDERRSRIRLNTRKSNYIESKLRERKTPHELLLELREMKKQYSSPHLARSLCTRHSSASSSSQRGSNRPVPLCTQPGSVHLPKKRSSATKQDVDFSRTESEPGVLRTSGLRRPNRHKTLSVRSYPSTSPHSAHRTRSISNSAPQLQSSCNITSGKRLTKLSSTRAELSRPQTHAIGPSYSQTNNKLLREPLIRRTHPSFSRTNRSWYKPNPILSHVTEIRPVDDSLLRHTFASLQKVRNKVRPVVSPTINGRPPMIFKR